MDGPINKINNQNLQKKIQYYYEPEYKSIGIAKCTAERINQQLVAFFILPYRSLSI